MIRSVIMAEFQADLQTVWDIVTDNENCEWRSDLSRIEILDEKHFVEYTTSGFPTRFEIAVKEECRRYEFNMDNKNLTGRWIGIFTGLDGGGARIEFTEELNVKNPIMAWIVRVLKPFKKMQEIYVRDLRIRLERV